MKVQKLGGHVTIDREALVRGGVSFAALTDRMNEQLTKALDTPAFRRFVQDKEHVERMEQDAVAIRRVGKYARLSALDWFERMAMRKRLDHGLPVCGHEQVVSKLGTVETCARWPHSDEIDHQSLTATWAHPPTPDPDEIPCPRCGNGRYISISLDGGYRRLAQCVPCGKVHQYLGPGYRSPNFRKGYTGGNS